MNKHCKHCSAKLSADMNSEWKWSCPECDHSNNEHPAYFNCENCHYSPKVAPCPNCKKDVDLEDLLFHNINTN